MRLCKQLTNPNISGDGTESEQDDDVLSEEGEKDEISFPEITPRNTYCNIGDKINYMNKFETINTNDATLQIAIKCLISYHYHHHHYY